MLAWAYIPWTYIRVSCAPRVRNAVLEHLCWSAFASALLLVQFTRWLCTLWTLLNLLRLTFP